MPTDVSEKLPALNREGVLEPGRVVKVLKSPVMVEAVEPARELGWAQTLVDLSCLEDDAHGERLSVPWKREVDAQILKQLTGGILPGRGSIRRTSSPLTPTPFGGTL